MRNLIRVAVFACASGPVFAAPAAARPPAPPATERAGNFNFEDFLKSSRSPILRRVLAEPERFRVQILYTRVGRDRNNRPTFQHYPYRVRGGEYFYPASLVKLPLALVALDRLNHLKIPGLNRNTPMHSAPAGVSEKYRDLSLGEHLHRMLVMSDNESSDCVYEFVGHDYLRRRLDSLGYRRTLIPRKFQSRAFELGGVEFRDSRDFLIHAEVPRAYAPPRLEDRRLVGRAHVEDGELLDGPMSFQGHNALTLVDAHKMILTLVFPETLKPQRRFKLSPDDRRFLLSRMGMLPRESKNPDYRKYCDTLRKYFFGHPGCRPLPDGVRVFNKVGLAYGFAADTAYIVNYKRRVEFFLSAVVYVNRNDVVNDGLYEYETIGMPFLSALGGHLYNHELKRHRRHRPRLYDPFR